MFSQFFRNNIHNKYNIYYYGFIFCEFLNVLCVLVAFHGTNLFLDRRWSWYGLEVFTYYQLPPEEQRITSRQEKTSNFFRR